MTLMVMIFLERLTFVILTRFLNYIENQTISFKNMTSHIESSKNKELYEWVYGNYNKYNMILERLIDCTNIMIIFNLRNGYVMSTIIC